MMESINRSEHSVSGLLESIQSTLVQYANNEKAIGMEAYMKHKFKYHGLTSPVRKEHTKDIVKKTKALSSADLWVLTHQLWRAEERENQYIAMDIWSKNIKKITESDICQIQELIVDKSWWDTVDWIAGHMVGSYFKHHPDILIAQTDEWIHSDNIWLNRTCLLYQLFYKDQTDFDRLYYYIECTKSKNEFFIQKAIGWSLRQYSRVDRDKVKSSVDKLNLQGLAKREALKLILK